MGRKVLVIEDDYPSLDLIAYLLKAFGYVPLLAIDGETGLAVARRERPELIICDVQLPKLKGLEVVKALKSDPELRDIPIIAVTAYAMVGDRERLLAGGFDGYIPKPIFPETFIKQIAEHLHPRQANSPETRSDIDG